MKCVWQQKTKNWKLKRVLITKGWTPFEGPYIFSHFLAHVYDLEVVIKPPLKKWAAPSATCHQQSLMAFM